MVPVVVMGPPRMGEVVATLLTPPPPPPVAAIVMPPAEGVMVTLAPAVSVAASKLPVVALPMRSWPLVGAAPLCWVSLFLQFDLAAATIWAAGNQANFNVNGLANGEVNVLIAFGPCTRAA